MKVRSRHQVLSCVGVAAVMAGLAAGSASRGAEPAVAPASVVLIVNADWTVSSLTRGDVESLFLGRKTQVGDVRAAFATLKEGDVHEAFLRDYVGKSAAQFKNYWVQRVLTGKGSAPRAFKTEAEMIRYVAGTPGAIGYVSAGAWSATDGAKTIAIE